MSDLARTVLERHSTRRFLPRPVPRDLVNEALALAQHAPSNSNIQPWRLVFVSGAARDRLKHALFSVADHEARTSHRCQKHSSITATSLGPRFTARWGSLSQTRRDTQPL